MGNIDKGNNTSAIKALKKIVESGLDTEDTHLMLARLYSKEGQLDLLVKEFEKVIEISSRKDEPFFKNKILNEIEIAQKKTILKSKPRGMGITLTARCNLRCIMCRTYDQPWDISEKTVREIIEYMPYLQQILWQGGEVFLSDYFEELFERATAYSNLKQLIVTSGVLIDEKWAKKLTRSYSSLVYSIDGVTKDTYEYIRRGAKFEDLLKSINMVNEYRERYHYDSSVSNKFDIQMNAVIMKSNYHQLIKFVDFAKKYKFGFLQLVPVQNMTGSENIFLHREPEAYNYIEKNMPEVLEKAKNWDIKLHNWLPPVNGAISNVKQYRAQEERIVNCSGFNYLPINTYGLLCYWPWQNLFLENGGRVSPYCYCPKEAGNADKSSLKEIWNNEIMQLYRKKLLDNSFQDWCFYNCVAGIITKEGLSLYWQ